MLWQKVSRPCCRVKAPPALPLPALKARVAALFSRRGEPAALATIYKICPAGLWQAAVAAGVFAGSELDRADGYIHFSTASQVADTLARHFAGVAGLVLAALDETKLLPPVRYEAARGGALFPHLYGTFDPRRALWVKPLTLRADGRHVLPELLA